MLDLSSSDVLHGFLMEYVSVTLNWGKYILIISICTDVDEDKVYFEPHEWYSKCTKRSRNKGMYTLESNWNWVDWNAQLRKNPVISGVCVSEIREMFTGHKRSVFYNTENLELYWNHIYFG